MSQREVIKLIREGANTAAPVGAARDALRDAWAKPTKMGLSYYTMLPPLLGEDRIGPNQKLGCNYSALCTNILFVLT